MNKKTASIPLPADGPSRLLSRILPCLVGGLLLAELGVPNARADYASTVSGFSPLAYWRFNGTNASPPLNAATNSSSLGSAADGNVVLDVDKGQPGIVGNAARFHNTGNNISYCGSKIDVPYLSAINPNPPFTIEFWAKPATLGTDVTGFCPLSSVNPHFSQNNRSGWLFYVSSTGVWQFRLGSESLYVATLNAVGGNAAADVWQHIVGVYDGSAAKLYVNGLLVGSVTLSAANNAAFRRNTQFALRIGGTPLSGSLSDSPAIISAGGIAGNRGFDGWVDEVAVYAYELSAATIAAHFAAATTNNAGYAAQILAGNPAGYWTLNDPAPTLPAASSYPIATNSGTLGSAADGTNVWGVLAAQPGPAYGGFGAANKACFFNGAGGYLSLGNPAGLNLSNQITLMAWINPAIKDFYRDIIAHGWDGGHQETFLRISRGSGSAGYGDRNYYEAGVTDGSTYYDTAAFQIPEGDVGNWIFLAGTYDGANWNLYRNGSLLAKVASTHGPRAITNRWSVGARSDPSAASGTYFGGYIDEPAIFGSALSAADIYAIYNSAQVPPIILRMPQSTTNFETMPTTFSVSAAGGLPLKYQWRKDGGNISGATNSSYTIAALTFGDAGNYSVMISNTIGFTNSAPASLTVLPAPLVPDADVQLTDTPDYNWFAGCFGTATGNLMGYWDRRGFPDFYTGPTAGGVAPLNNCGNNIGIRAMWASKAGLDGRATNSPGHIDDYWSAYTISFATCGANDSYSYESTVTDPFITAGRAEHVADCIGDFIGVSQKRWTNMNNECDGNIDAYSFVFWDTNGTKRLNYVPPAQGTNLGKDIPSGLREWARFRGYDAEVFSQLVSFNPNCPPGLGFTFSDLRAEIDAGYPVLVFLEPYSQLSRSLSGMPKANPEIHGMMVYGYQAYAGFGTNVYCRTSWGSGDNVTYNWSTTPWVGSLSVRGVIGFHPKPKIRSLALNGPDVTVNWDGPTSQLSDLLNSTTTPLHTYQLERSLALQPPDFQPIGSPTASLSITVPDAGNTTAFYRVRLLPP